MVRFWLSIFWRAATSILCFLIEQLFENLAGFLADGIGVFDEFDLVHLLEHVGNGAGQYVDFVAAESHSTALYLRTSSVFTLRNISW